MYCTVYSYTWVVIGSIAVAIGVLCYLSLYFLLCGSIMMIPLCLQSFCMFCKNSIKALGRAAYVFVDSMKHQEGKNIYSLILISSVASCYKITILREYMCYHHSRAYMVSIVCVCGVTMTISFTEWHGVVFVRDGPFRKGIFKFIIYIPDKYVYSSDTLYVCVCVCKCVQCMCVGPHTLYL